eukprot:9473487-Pyramimonas_sp.AAC.2
MRSRSMASGMFNDQAGDQVPHHAEEVVARSNSWMLDIQTPCEPKHLHTAVRVAVPVDHLVDRQVLDAVDLPPHLVQLEGDDRVRAAKELVLPGARGRGREGSSLSLIHI